MNDREFKELEGIRTDLKTKRDRIDELEGEIKECRQKEHEKLDPMRQELAEKKVQWYNDPDKRAKYGIEKQAPWKIEIDKILAPAQNKIEDIATDFEIERETRQKEIRELKKEIKDLTMEHTNKHAYYSQVETQKVSIDFNVKDAIQQEAK